MNIKFIFFIYSRLISAQSSLNKFFSNQDINEQLAEKGVDTDAAVIDAVSTTNAPVTTAEAPINKTATDISPTHQPSEVNQYTGQAYNPYQPEYEEGEQKEEVFNMTSYILNLQMMPPEEINVRPLDPESIELDWKIPTNLRRDKLKFNIILRYYNTRQTEEQASQVTITKVYLVNDPDRERGTDTTIGKFILRDLTRYIEYNLSMYVKIYMNVPDFERPGMMKEIEKESYPSSWKRVRTDAKIFSGFFNFTKGKRETNNSPVHNHRLWTIDYGP